MKKLLVLGGAEKSLPLVRHARARGHTLVLCDREPQNPCRELVDVFIELSTIDHLLIADAARRHRVDGVVSFGSDMNAVSAARIAAALSLPGNPPNSVLTMVRKDLFRSFLATNGFNCPRHESINSLADVSVLSERLSLPLIVKPVDGAGSNGVTKINFWEEFEQAFHSAQTVSKTGNVVVEEFLERRHPHVIGGDIFVQGGKIVFWGLLDSRRDSPWAPFLPTGTGFPATLTSEEREEVQATLSQLVSALKIKFGGLNVELMFDTKGKLYVIELAPRNGGNQIPELLKRATGADLIAALVDSALGDKVVLPSGANGQCVANYMLHSRESGIFNGLHISPEISANVVKQEIYVKPGDPISAFRKATDSFGVLTFQFDSKAEAESLLSKINELIKVT
jgi:biotin carboxylase